MTELEMKSSGINTMHICKQLLPSVNNLMPPSSR